MYKITPKNKTSYLEFFIYIFRYWIVFIVVSEFCYLVAAELWPNEIFVSYLSFLRSGLIFSILTALKENKIHQITLNDQESYILIKYSRIPFPNEQHIIKYEDLSVKFTDGSNPSLFLMQKNGHTFVVSTKKDGFEREELKQLQTVLDT